MSDHKCDSISPPTSLNISVFVNSSLVGDFVCAVCDNIPLPPNVMTSECCGKTFCTICTNTIRNSVCTACNVSMAFIAAPFAQTKISGADIRCINEQCKWKGCVGHKSKRIQEHLANECQYTPIACPGCRQLVLRGEMKEHRGEYKAVDDCQHKPMMCNICNVSVLRDKLEQHMNSAEHKLKMDNFNVSRMIQAEKEISTLKHEMVEMKKYYEMKSKMDTEYLLAVMDSEHLDFTVENWKDILIKPGEECAVMFSSDAPKLAYDLHFWLKVEKARSGHIGLYLCCGDLKDTGSAVPSTSSRFPFTCKYQLFVRRRNTDVVAYSGPMFTTDYGKEKAWGRAKFTTLDHLTQCGAYTPQEDKITFGALIFPMKNMRWLPRIFTEEAYPLPSQPFSQSFT